MIIHSMVSNDHTVIYIKQTHNGEELFPARFTLNKPPPTTEVPSLPPLPGPIMSPL